LDAEQGSTAQDSTDGSLLDGFRHVEVASVSDALEQLSGRKMYMSHRMRPIFPTRFVGFALTVSLKKEENHNPDSLTGMLAAFDQGKRIWIVVLFLLQRDGERKTYKSGRKNWNKTTIRMRLPGCSRRSITAIETLYM